MTVRFPQQHIANRLEANEPRMKSMPSFFRSQEELDGTNAFTSSSTYWVDDDGSGDGTSEDHPAPSIVYILTHYDLKNDIVKVKPGTYEPFAEEFPLNLTDTGMKLEATGKPSNTIINPQAGHTIRVTADDVIVSGFTIKNTLSDCIVFISSSGSIVEHNVMSGGRNGVNLRNSADTTIKHNTFKNLGTGIVFSSSDGNTVRHNKFIDPGLKAQYELSIGGQSKNNLIYKNDFLDIGHSTPLEEGGNDFNSENIGNHWSDYKGSDLDGDGIGDTPYSTYSMESKDHKPSVERFTGTDRNAPSVTIKSPSEGKEIDAEDITIKWEGFR